MEAIVILFIVLAVIAVCMIAAVAIVVLTLSVFEDALIGKDPHDDESMVIWVNTDQDPDDDVESIDDFDDLAEQILDDDEDLDDSDLEDDAE